MSKPSRPLAVLWPDVWPIESGFDTVHLLNAKSGARLTYLPLSFGIAQVRRLVLGWHINAL